VVRRRFASAADRAGDFFSLAATGAIDDDSDSRVRLRANDAVESGERVVLQLRICNEM
jgi:hypothetical protein